MRRFSFRNLRNPLRTVYDEAGLLPVIRRSLTLIMMGNLFGNAFGVICGSGTAAMVGLATAMGAGDLVFGILSAVPQVAAVLQIPFSTLVSRTQKRKRYMMTFGMAGRVVWLLMGLLPLIIPGSKTAQLVALLSLIAFASVSNSMVNVCWFPWFSDLAPIRIRGRWLSLRDQVGAAVNLSVGLLSGVLLDKTDPSFRYILIFLIGGTLGMCDMFCFSGVKEVYSTPPSRTGMLRVIRRALKDKPYVRLLIMWTGWCFAANMGGVYIYPYAMNVLGLSFFQLTVFNTTASAIATMIAVPRWGKALDRFGAKSVMMVAGLCCCVCQAFYLFATPGHVLPTFLHAFTGGLTWSGTGLAANSLQLSCSPDDDRPTYIALFSCIPALLGTTLGSLAGGALLEFWEARSCFTGYIDRYKVLFLLGCVLRLVVILLFVPPMTNDREGTGRDLVRSILHLKEKKA